MACSSWTVCWHLQRWHGFGDGEVVCLEMLVGAWKSLWHGVAGNGNGNATCKPSVWSRQ
jgi:hypothetical protein